MSATTRTLDLKAIKERFERVREFVDAMTAYHGRTWTEDEENRFQVLCDVEDLITCVEQQRDVLDAFAQAYANTDRKSHDSSEVAIFRAWLRAAACLGYDLKRPKTRIDLDVTFGDSEGGES